MRMIKVTLFSVMLVLSSLPLAQAAWWEPVLSCDNGAAVIDIDLGERRNTQLVIRNPETISYFNEEGAQLTGTSWLVWDGRLHNLTNNANETVIPGELNAGVFRASLFRGFSSPVSYSGRQFHVYREGRGLKVEVVIPGHGSRCGGDWDSGGGCNNPIERQSEQKIADWYFQDCEEL